MTEHRFSICASRGLKPAEHGSRQTECSLDTRAASLCFDVVEALVPNAWLPNSTFARASAATTFVRRWR